MKRWLIAWLILAAATTSARATSVLGELYFPGQDLRVIRTRYFRIIYSPGSADTAAVLSGYADETMERIAGFLNAPVRKPVTVVLTPDPQIENGFASPVPYDNIVLVDYRSGYLLNSRDYLRQLFTHELTHILSLNMKSGLFEGLSRVFGNIMAPNLSVPGFMLEGVTVSFESLDGSGRVYEPTVVQEIRQDILENRFKTPAQASGPYDRYPDGSIRYHYGGLFSDYLQGKYGMDKYAELWAENGGAFPYTFACVFRSVTGEDFHIAWKNFREDLRPDFPVQTNRQDADGLRDRLFRAGDAVMKNGRIYFTDEFDRDVKVYDTKTRKLETLFDGTGEIDVSADGRRLAVTMLGAEAGVFRKITRVYDLEKRRFTDESWRNLGKSAFGPLGMVAVRAANRLTDLVLVSPGGSVRTLLAGTDTLSVENPVVLSDTEIVLILVDDGERRVARLELDTGEIRVADIPARFVRDLSVAPDGRILFTYNNDYTFNKAGVLDRDTFALQTVNRSGGVFWPMTDGENVYYFGKYSEGHRLQRAEGGMTNLFGPAKKFVWKPFARGEKPRKPAAEVLAVLDPKPYNLLPDLLPRVWLPYATFGRNSLPDSLGFYTVLMDPVYQNSVTLYTTYNYYKVFQNVSVTWENSSLPIRMSLTGQDLVAFYESLPGYARKTGAAVNFSALHRYAPYWHTLQAGTVFRYSAVSTNTGEGSAYDWPYVHFQPVWSLYFQYSTAVKKYRFFDFKGFTVTAYYDYQPVTNIYKTEASLWWYPPVVPLSLRLSGGYSFWRVFTLGGVSGVFGYTHYPVYREYASDTNVSDFTVNGEATLPVFNWEIQQGPGLFPLYFKRLYLLAGYRGAYLERYVQSVFARAELVTTPFYGGLVPDVRLWAEGTYAITTDRWGYSLNFSIDW